MTERLHKPRIAARWVPHDLSEEQKCRRVEIAQLFLHRFREEGNEFLLENCALILHDNARPHIGKVVRELFDRYSWEVLPHPPYIPDMSLPDFDLFPKLNINMHGVRFSTLEDLSASVT